MIWSLVHWEHQEKPVRGPQGHHGLHGAGSEGLGHRGEGHGMGLGHQGSSSPPGSWGRWSCPAWGFTFLADLDDGQRCTGSSPEESGPLDAFGAPQEGLDQSRHQLAAVREVAQ